jgi:hypothetical protein
MAGGTPSIGRAMLFAGRRLRHEINLPVRRRAARGLGAALEVVAGALLMSYALVGAKLPGKSPWRFWTPPVWPGRTLVWQGITAAQPGGFVLPGGRAACLVGWR